MLSPIQGLASQIGPWEGRCAGAAIDGATTASVLHMERKPPTGERAAISTPRYAGQPGVVARPKKDPLGNI
jgi:hypothetical protein